MTLKWAGGTESDHLTTGEIQAGWSIGMTEFGCSEATLQKQFICKEASDKTYIDTKAINAIGEKHPYADWLICESSSVQHNGAVATQTLQYAGIPKNMEAVKYKISASLAEEPIDTHPRFPEFAGKPSKMSDQLGFVATTGAVFTGKNDLKDTFVEFVAKNNTARNYDTNSKIGVSGYLKSDIVYEETRTLGEGLDKGDTSDLIGDLGDRYDDIPDTIRGSDSAITTVPNLFPDDYDDANWMMIHASYEAVGDGGLLTRKWRMSGRYGWNELVYVDGKDSVGNAGRSDSDFGAGGDALNDMNDTRKLMAGETQDTSLVGENSSFSINEMGKATANITYVVETGKGLDLAKDVMTGGSNAHPDYDYLTADKATVTGLVGFLEQVDISFTGVESEKDWKVKMDVQTGVEPIDSHPNFIEGVDGDDGIGGKLGDEKNGAQFNDDKTFDKFSKYVPEDLASQAWWKTRLDSDAIIDGHMPNAMGGVESYLEVGVTWTETKCFKEISDAIKEVVKIGTLDDPQSTDNKPPRVRGANNVQRTWLIVGVTWDMVGIDPNSGYVVSMTYRLSGEKPWDTEIYGDEAIG